MRFCFKGDFFSNNSSSRNQPRQISTFDELWPLRSKKLQLKLISYIPFIEHLIAHEVYNTIADDFSWTIVLTNFNLPRVASLGQATMKLVLLNMAKANQSSKE